MTYRDFTYGVPPEIPADTWAHMWATANSPISPIEWINAYWEADHTTERRTGYRYRYEHNGSTRNLTGRILGTCARVRTDRPRRMATNPPTPKQPKGKVT